MQLNHAKKIILGTIFTILSFSINATTIDELKEQVDNLSNQIQTLKREKSASNPFNVKISGSINTGILSVKDGRNNNSDDAKKNLWIVTNDNACSRIKIDAIKNYDDNITLGTAFEFGFSPNGTCSINQNKTEVQNLSTLTTRVLDLYINSHYGTLYLGQGHTATDGIAENDLSGTTIVAYSGVESSCGGLNFRDKQSKNLVADKTVGSLFQNLDGLGRQPRLRYDTPKWKNVQAKASMLDSGDFDLGISYSKENILNCKLNSSIGYANHRQNEGKSSFSGSISVLHTSGINLTIAGGSQDLASNYTSISGEVVYTKGRKNPNYIYTKVGIIKNYLKIGESAISFDFYKGQHFSADNDKSISYSIAAVQNISKIDLQIFLGIRNFNTKDTSSNSYESISAFLGGARFEF